MVNFTVKLCYPHWLNIACLFCHLDSYSGWSTCSHGKAGSKLDCRQLYGHGKTNELTRSQPTWLPCPGSYAWTLQDISTHVKYYRLAEESLAINMGRRT